MNEPHFSNSDEAKKLASDLSDNLYYVSEFTPSALRVFLDSLPTIYHVYASRNFVDGTLKNGQVVIYLERRSISFSFSGDDWILDTYFRKLRPVPIRLQDDYFINFKSPVLCEENFLADAAESTTAVAESEFPTAGFECGNS